MLILYTVLLCQTSLTQTLQSSRVGVVGVRASYTPASLKKKSSNKHIRLVNKIKIKYRILVTQYYAKCFHVE